MAAHFALFNDILLDSHQAYWDVGASFYLRYTFVKTAALVTSRCNVGFYALLNAQKEPLNLNMVATKIVYRKNNVTNYFLDNLVDNNSASLSYMLSSDDLLGIQANYTRRIGEFNPSYGAGGFYQHHFFSYKGIGFFFNATANRAVNVGNSYFLSLSVQFNQGGLSGIESISWQNQTNCSNNNQMARPFVVQGDTIYSKQNEVGIGYAWNEMHTFSPTVSSIAGLYNYTNQQGFISSYLNYNHTTNQPQMLGYGGTAETALVVNQQGISLNGVQSMQTAGMIVRVQVDDLAQADTKFALVDGFNRKLAFLQANKNIFVPLPSFIDEDISLINLSNKEYHIEHPTQHITLYPGNVGHYVWQVSKRIILIGRIISKKAHRPLVNAWIHWHENGIFSDEEGYFQLELPTQAKTLTADYEEGTCRLNLPPLKSDKAYLYLGEIVCT